MVEHDNKNWHMETLTSSLMGDYQGLSKYDNQGCTTAHARLSMAGVVCTYKMDGDRLAFGTWESYAERQGEGTKGIVRRQG